MDFIKIKTWLKKMNQVIELYQDSSEFTSTEKSLLLDYAFKLRMEIEKIQVQDFEDLELSDPPIQIDPIPLKSIPIDNTSTKNLKNKTEDIKMEEATPVRSELYQNLFDHLDIKDLSSKLELKPLADIKSGMGLNEKIQTQNELFNGDKTAFEEIIKSLNECDDFNAARTYLCEQVIPKYDWTNPAKENLVDAFIKYVKRRHL